MKNKNKIFVFASLGLLLISSYLQPIHADNPTGVYIVNPQIIPATIAVGDTFAINATFVNVSNSTVYIQNNCLSPFTTEFDEHATVDLLEVCRYAAIQEIIPPGASMTFSAPGANLDYKAVAAGQANATITFSYSMTNATSGTTVSSSFMFPIIENNTGTTTPSENNTGTPTPPTTPPTPPPTTPPTPPPTTPPTPPPTTPPPITAPLKQVRSGTSPTAVTCSADTQLVFKTEDHSPACVKPASADKLVSWGWATTS